MRNYEADALCVDGWWLKRSFATAVSFLRYMQLNRGAHSRIVISKKFNGQYIELASCETFSIAAEPITLWALGQSGWLEIRPSEKFQRMHNMMAEAISIYYFVADLYEKEKRKKGSKTPLSIDKVLLKVCDHG
jgi:hypothetical protein